MKIESGDIKFFETLSGKIKKTFSKLGQVDDTAGFVFLWNEYLKKEKKIRPIICALKDNRIVGAIGPLTICIDYFGNKFLQPPFFGVLKAYKRSGFGKKLWLSASDYAAQNGAKYTLVQNTPNSPAGKFYENQGLEVGCKVYSCSL